MSTYRERSIYGSTKSNLLDLAQRFGAARVAPSGKHIQYMLFVFGVSVLTFGLADVSLAQVASVSITSGMDSELSPHDIVYTDDQIQKALVAILTMIEGSFGALVMVASGIGAILGSAFGQYRSALGCLVVAVGAFILRSVMFTFFNLPNLEDPG